MGYTNYTALTPFVGGIQALSATSSTAVGLTITAVSAASAQNYQPDFAVIVCETQAVRWRDDGTDPTATVGMPLAIGTYMQYDGKLRSLKFIGQAGQAIVNVALYRSS